MAKSSGPSQAISLSAAAVGFVIVLAFARGGLTEATHTATAMSADHGDAINEIVARAEGNACATCHQSAAAALPAPTAPGHVQPTRMTTLLQQERAAVMAYLAK